MLNRSTPTSAPVPPMPSVESIDTGPSSRALRIMCIGLFAGGAVVGGASGWFGHKHTEGRADVDAARTEGYADGLTEGQRIALESTAVQEIGEITATMCVAVEQIIEDHPDVTVRVSLADLPPCGNN